MHSFRRLCGTALFGVAPDAERACVRQSTPNVSAQRSRVACVLVCGRLRVAAISRGVLRGLFVLPFRQRGESSVL
eukprot:10468647-Lingulodinium_polyedra.AAC.1